ncbi:MAG TPA: hypothetical protein GX532_06835 [Clostridia bacterium]|jgi:MinD-like ATPase involved in chromosome partitioning or flagellar assembly|nr:hypothetical protein [Clostridia bacterium]HHY06669.1 hypothetical protein [Clostridia bacterium]
MGKLRLMLVDRDVEYVNCLLNYLMSEQAEKFAVSSFTEESAVDKFLAEEKTVDLVLTSSEFYTRLTSKAQGVIILLAEEQEVLRGKQCHVISKYQYGEQLVAEILKIYAEEVSEVSLNCLPNYLKQKTRIIGVYSPLGGVGKTTIAVGASIQSAWEGKSVFYLNLENISSIPLYFTGKQEKNLSHVLYFLKEKRENLAWQIESAKCRDPNYKIHYFRPPDSILDFNEDIRKELILLLQELKGAQQYERIFLDFSAEINKNNLALLQACDDIILVAQANLTSCVKIKCLRQELRLLLPPEEEEDLVHKFSLVLNKERAGVVKEVEEISINQKGVCARIPWVENLTSRQGNVYRLDFNSGFGQAIHQLLLRF